MTLKGPASSPTSSAFAPPSPSAGTPAPAAARCAAARPPRADGAGRSARWLSPGTGNLGGGRTVAATKVENGSKIVQNVDFDHEKLKKIWRFWSSDYQKMRFYEQACGFCLLDWDSYGKNDNATGQLGWLTNTEGIKRLVEIQSPIGSFSNKPSWWPLANFSAATQNDI